MMIRSQANVLAGARFSLISRATRKRASVKPAMEKRVGTKPLARNCSRNSRRVSSMALGRHKAARGKWQGRGKKSLPSGARVKTFRAPCLVGYSSGQRGQTVNLLGSALHWFESSSYHHFLPAHPREERPDGSTTHGASSQGPAPSNAVK